MNIEATISQYGLEEGVIIIHTENATDEERIEIAERLALWMQDNYPHLAMSDEYRN